MMISLFQLSDLFKHFVEKKDEMVEEDLEVQGGFFPLFLAQLQKMLDIERPSEKQTNTFCIGVEFLSHCVKVNWYLFEKKLCF